MAASARISRLRGMSGFRPEPVHSAARMNSGASTCAQEIKTAKGAITTRTLSIKALSCKGSRQLGQDTFHSFDDLDVHTAIFDQPCKSHRRPLAVIVLELEPADNRAGRIDG